MLANASREQAAALMCLLGNIDLLGRMILVLSSPVAEVPSLRRSKRNRKIGQRTKQRNGKRCAHLNIRDEMADDVETNVHDPEQERPLCEVPEVQPHYMRTVHQHHNSLMTRVQ